MPCDRKRVDILPTVLLGLRTCYKEDIGCSVAELLYGTTLRIRGEFFNDDTTEDTSALLQQLRDTMRKIRPVPTTNHGNMKIFVHPALHTCTHVFLGADAVRKPLQPPYTGPHKIVKRISDKGVKWSVIISEEAKVADILVSIKTLRNAHSR